jgi:hypothetical protein
MGVISNIGTEEDFQIAQGADFTAQFVVNQPNNSPLNLAGARVSADIKDTNETSVVRCTFACTGDGAAGRVVVLAQGALLNGTFAAGDSVTGVTSAATGTVVSFDPVTLALVLGGVSGTFQIGEELHDTTASFTTTALTLSVGATTLFTASGIVNLTLLAVNNVLAPGANLTDPEGQYVWDLKVVLASGAVLRPYFGNVSVVAAVTP